MSGAIADSLSKVSDAVRSVSGFRERVTKGSTDKMKQIVKDAATAFPVLSCDGTGAEEKDLRDFVCACDEVREDTIKAEEDQMKEWEDAKTTLEDNSAENTESIKASLAKIDVWQMQMDSEQAKIAVWEEQNVINKRAVDVYALNMRDLRPGLDVYKAIQANKEIAFSAARMARVSELQKHFFVATREEVESKIGGDRKLAVNAIHALIVAEAHKHTSHVEPIKIDTFHEIGKISIGAHVDLICKILGIGATRVARALLSGRIALRHNRSIERKRSSEDDGTTTGDQPPSKKQCTTQSNM